MQTQKKLIRNRKRGNGRATDPTKHEKQIKQNKQLILEKTRTQEKVEEKRKKKGKGVDQTCKLQVKGK